MTAKQFRYSLVSVIIVFIFTSFFIIWLSKEAIVETENWKPFDFDFTNREGVISSYASLLAGILSFIAILLVLLDLLYQRRTKQAEMEVMEINRIEEHRDRLDIISLFTRELLKDINTLNKSAEEFTEKEKLQPWEMNKMGFAPKTYPKLILDVDRVSFYEAMRFFHPGENWKEIYVELYKIVDFYAEAFEDLREKYKNHLSKKFDLSTELAEALDHFIDSNSRIRNSVIIQSKEEGKDPQSNPYFSVLQFVKERAVTIVQSHPTSEERASENFISPSSFKVWHDEVWQPVFNNILLLWNTHGNDPYNLESLLTQVQKLIRKYSRLTQDSLDYALHVEDYYKMYFNEKSRFPKQLKKIQREIEEVF
ncbi:hypothetical protein [Salegentibacter maritimus]|uniref:Phage abortive infection protein n=1 Tax=Salegentibacter maritimus TaxID=2794347 RepID=A0ABS0TJT3_9FLAO|nr:hypothetical protein [Salegentibacter maritimus]MBI6121030.1 hypothetical protein [Salegentibacter maritimus]